MLSRIGSSKPPPKIFAKFDFTSGYHQAPLSKSSRPLTAFITILGLFEWLRVPMGPTDSASYFQRVICSIVLVGLLYSFVEAYIDDVLIHAPTEELFLERLEIVFERFRKHKITLNPEKCFLGLEEVEFVGHIISQRGITFSRDRIDKILNIQPPVYEKGLKRFLGIVNYFHDHIKNHSILVHPLQLLVLDYTPSRKIKWTTEALTAFENIKELINQCPTLSFLHETAPVYLHTDASDYGIGAYLFQVIDNVEQPIAFMSRALSQRESRWSTPEKECYAIYYALVKFEYLLRDVKFCIRTDHKNLTYLNESANPKVNRWKLKIQHFNFDIEYIPGEQNIVADSLSRLVVTDSKDLSLEYLAFIEECNLLEAFKLDNSVFQKISKVHNSQAGHHGVDLTLLKLEKDNQNWPHMREHIKKFIKQCPCCQKMSVLKVPIHTHPYTTAAYEPMERLNIDTMGPFDVDEAGNAHIIVIIDCFTRFVELYPVPDTSALAAAEALLKHFGRYGCAYQLLSDNGSQYVNDIIYELIKLVGTEHIRTLAYSKEENSIVERANKEVLRHLRAIVFDQNVSHRWSFSLPFVQRIINASVDRSIGVNPAALLFGNAINLDKGIFLPFPHRHDDNDLQNENGKQTPLSKWSANLISIQQAVIEAARKTQLDKDSAHLAEANPQRTEFEIDSYVLVHYPSSTVKKGPPNKLQTNLKGPLKVINKKGAIYTLQNLVTSKHENHHITQLRPFYFDPLNHDPADFANRDYFSTVVESIISHTPLKPTYKKQKVSEMSFQVRWKNLPEEYDRIIPWKELRNNPALHKYLSQNAQLKHLIPKEHRTLTENSKSTE
jgi:hypothetical protein